MTTTMIPWAIHTSHGRFCENGFCSFIGWEWCGVLGGNGRSANYAMLGFGMWRGSHH